MKYYIDIPGNVFAYESDGSQDHLIGNKVAMTAQEVEAHINPPLTPDQLIAIKWASVKTQWDALTVTTTALHTFAANEEAMKLMAFKANNMGSSAVILWVEDWASFNTNIVELKEALNLAADAHQTIFNSVFGV